MDGVTTSATATAPAATVAPVTPIALDTRGTAAGATEVPDVDAPPPVLGHPAEARGFEGPEAMIKNRAHFLVDLLAYLAFVGLAATGLLLAYRLPAGAGATSH